MKGQKILSSVKTALTLQARERASGTLKVRGPRLEDHQEDDSPWTVSVRLTHGPGPTAAFAFSPACVSAGGSLVQWEGREPALVGSCHLISCVTWGFEHLMFLSLRFLILAKMDNSFSVGVSGFNEL